MSRRLANPRPAPVRSGPEGIPLTVDGEPVEVLREEWVVEDRWWTGRPVRRRYFELVLTQGRNAVVFCDLVRGAWFEQRG